MFFWCNKELMDLVAWWYWCFLYTYVLVWCSCSSFATGVDIFSFWNWSIHIMYSIFVVMIQVSKTYILCRWINFLGRKYHHFYLVCCLASYWLFNLIFFVVQKNIIVLLYCNTSLYSNSRYYILKYSIRFIPYVICTT